MDNLRLILILIGLLVLALIVLLHKPDGDSRRNHARWRTPRREPTLGGSDGHYDAADRANGPTAETAARRPGAEMPAADDAADSADAPAPAGDRSAAGDRLTLDSSPDKIVSLYICRRADKRISGSELLDAAIRAGLNFGEMNIFHRRHQGASRPVFSMANLTPPGHFDSSQWNVFDTPGVTLFLTLPAPVSGLDAWDAMLATAERISKLLEADVLDDTRCLLTRQRIAQIREEMREYDRRSGMIKPQ